MCFLKGKLNMHPDIPEDYRINRVGKIDRFNVSTKNKKTASAVIEELIIELHDKNQ